MKKDDVKRDFFWMNMKFFPEQNLTIRQRRLLIGDLMDFREEQNTYFFKTHSNSSYQTIFFYVKEFCVQKYDSQSPQRKTDGVVKIFLLQLK